YEPTHRRRHLSGYPLRDGQTAWGCWWEVVRRGWWRISTHVLRNWKATQSSQGTGGVRRAIHRFLLRWPRSPGLAEFRSMIAAVLAGGFGTRLRPVVADRPKVVATVRGRPFLSYLLDQVADAGIRDVVICSGYRGDAIPDTFDSKFRNMKLHYSRELQPLGTAGALHQAALLFDSELVLVMNGDSYCDVDLEKFEQWHRAR